MPERDQTWQTGRLAPHIRVPPELEERYQLGRVLGCGGMGMVVHAEERATGRPRAIKFLTRVEDEVVLARFLREGEILKRIAHPNVLPVLEVGAAGACPYLICELLPGGSLREHLDREKRLEPRIAVTIACGVLAGLAALHEQGIIHRDVKPGNIVFDADGRPRIADLGLAKVWGDPEQLTKTGALLGTPKYMAPEQANGEPVGVPADVYSVGVVLYEMLSGRVPFEEEEVFLLIVAHIEKPPPPLSSVAPGVPAALAEVVMRALAKSRVDRPAGALAFREQLKRAQSARHGIPLTRRGR